MNDDDVVWVNDNVEAKYANSFRIGFNALEVMIDFALRPPESRIAVLHTRIIVPPTLAEDLLELLTTSMDQLRRMRNPGTHD